MFDYARRRELGEWLSNVLLASVIAVPDEPGLTYEEVQELGKRRGYGLGEIGAAWADHVNDGVLAASVREFDSARS